ncbi:MAG: hypothetical protein V1835_00965 [Candidatus Micrarchaeota archaeon]
MKGLTVGLFLFAFAALVMQVSALEVVPNDATYNYDPYQNAYSFCGDNICDFGEYCYSDCGPQMGGPGYYDPYGGYYGGYETCYISTPINAYVNDLVPIQISYYGNTPYSIQVSCGDGSVTTAYRNGIYAYDGILYAHCRYTYEGIFYPKAFAGSVTCGGDYINVLGSSGTHYPYPTSTPRPTPGPTAYPLPSPSPSPRPAYPSCALTSYPSAIAEGDSSIISVSYYDLSRAPNAISVDCGNGITKNAIDCLGTTGSCSVFCNYNMRGTYTAKAIAAGTSCSLTTVSVGTQTAEKCSDGTSFGTCSANKPKYCDDGILVDKASVCGCPDGKVASGERCITPAGSCSITLNPSTVRANEQTNVIINYRGIDLSQTGDLPPLPENSQVKVVCGNGNTEIASCDSYDSLSGSCSASCAYGEETTYPKTYSVKAFVKGMQCSTANVQVISPSQTTGTLLAKVSDCDTGNALQHARVRIEGQQDYYTDANGQLKVSLEPATYNLEASKSGYLPATDTAEILRGKIITANVCLQAEGCDITAELVRTPTSDDSGTPLLYQIKVTNNLNGQNEIDISYSSAMRIEGDTHITLQAKGAQTIQVWVYANARTVGRSVGTVSIRGTGSCTKNIDLPINVVGGLSVELQQPYKETFGGKKVCYDFLVRNRGNNEGTVTLSYSGDFDADFNIAQFYLNAQEIREDLQFCVTPDSGDTGTHTFYIRALSPISDASAYATLKVLDTGDFQTDADNSCLYVGDAGELIPIIISNDVANGDYAVALRNNNANARITPSMLYNFEKGTSRTVYISASPSNIGGDTIVQLVLKKDSQVAMQSDICLSTNSYYYGYYYQDGYYYNDGYYYGSGYSSRSMKGIYSQLSQSALNVPKGGSDSTVLTIKNTGTYGDYYFIRVESQISASISESSFYLAPNEEKKVTIKFTAPTDATSVKYSVPIKIYSGRGSGGVVNNGNYATGGTGYIKCGNGNTAVLDCEEGSSSCTATCRYEMGGTYTIAANVGSQQCRAANVRVLPDGNRGCAVSAESFVKEDTRTTVRVRYFNLPASSQDEEITIYCGNGNLATADGCNGRTGTCSASCYYGNSGTYTIGATAGGVSCTSAEIKIGTESTYCSILSPGIVEEGNSATISLRYGNVYFGGQFYPYGYGTSTYSGSGQLLKTETVIVNVGGGGGSATITPGNLNPDAIEVKRVLSSDLPTAGKANAAITLKNNRDYKLDEIVLLIEDLPTGVSLMQVKPFTLDAGIERTIYFQFDTANAKEGIFKVNAKIRYDGQAVEKQFEIKIVPESEVMNAEIKVVDTVYGQSGSDGIAKITFEVRNNEVKPLSVSALLRELPDTWTVQIDPALAVIKSGGSANFTVNVTAKAVEQKTYAAFIELRGIDGRNVSVPIALEFSKLNPLSGLFSFASSLGGAQVVALFLILAVALYVFFSGRRYREEAGSLDEEGRSDRLRGIGDEIMPERKNEKQTTLLDEKKFSKKKSKYSQPENYEDTAFIETDDEENAEDVLTRKNDEDEE